MVRFLLIVSFVSGDLNCSHFLMLYSHFHTRNIMARPNDRVDILSPLFTFLNFFSKTKKKIGNYQLNFNCKLLNLIDMLRHSLSFSLQVTHIFRVCTHDRMEITWTWKLIVPNVTLWPIVLFPFDMSYFTNTAILYIFFSP